MKEYRVVFVVLMLVAAALVLFSPSLWLSVGLFAVSIAAGFCLFGWMYEARVRSKRVDSLWVSLRRELLYRKQEDDL